jgi:hypothetical protein
MSFDHLRPGDKSLVQAIERIKHQMGMDVRRPVCAPDRVERDKIWCRNELKRSFALRPCDMRYGKARRAD